MNLQGLSKSLCFLLIFCCLCSLAFSQSAVPPAVDKQAILKQARHAYYSLKSEGFAQFQCGMDPNWESLLAEQRKPDPNQHLSAEAEAERQGRLDRAIARLKLIHFLVTVDANGAAKVTHNEITADNEEMAKGLAQIYGGMEQMTTGFFQTWSAFVIAPGLPELGTEFQLENVGPQYRITYKDGGADVVTSMDKNFAISSTKVTTKEFNSVLNPQFIKSAKGFLMNAYQATYQGASPADTTELKVAIDYQQINGLQVPKKLDLKGTYGGNPFQVEVAFTGCAAARQ